MERLNQLNAEIRTPGAILDSRNEVICSCGYKRDCGRMATTARHLADVHADGTGHSPVVIVSPCEAPPRVETVKKIASRGRRRGGRDGKLGID